MNVIELTQLHAAPWGKELLRDIDLCIKPGSIMGIIGPNGAGKTTLLQVLCGLIGPSQGSVTLLGRPLADWPRLERARRLAILPQHSTLSFPFSVSEVVLLGRTPHRSGSEADREITHQAMAATDTLALQGRPYTQLSGGEQQRVQLARTLAQIWPADAPSDRLLLLDEPTAALDLQHQHLVVGTLRRLAEQGCAIAVIMHDLNLLASLADQFMVLADGRCAAQGSAAEVLRESTFREVFKVEVRIEAHPRSGKPLVITL